MRKTISFLLLLHTCNSSFAQTGTLSGLQKKIQYIIDTSKANIGVAIKRSDAAGSIVINGSKHFPMQSVYKLPLAIAVLDLADKGKLSLNEKVKIAKQSLDTHTWSPMVREHPAQDLELSITELLTYAISKSDNNACDILFKLVGGTGHVNKFIHDLGIREIQIAATETEMKQGWQIQYSNWCQPDAMLHLLELLHEGKLISPANTHLLMKMMTKSENSPKRIKGLLAENTVVAHKTGTSNTNAQGITAATNDVGIITLPDGKRLAIVVYVSDYKGGVERGEHIIAEISKTAWQYYTAHK